MKKLRLHSSAVLAANLLLAAVFLSSCETPQGQSVEETSNNYNIKVIDSCEYIEFDSGIFDQRVYSLTHKGNCKFCVARHSR
jgi:predicted small secreted protein